MMRNRLASHANALAGRARQEAENRLDSLRLAAEAELEAQRNRLEEEARSRVTDILTGGEADSTALIPLDSLKKAGEGKLRDQVRGLLGRKKKRINNEEG